MYSRCVSYLMVVGSKGECHGTLLIEAALEAQRATRRCLTQHDEHISLHAESAQFDGPLGSLELHYNINVWHLYVGTKSLRIP